MGWMARSRHLSAKVVVVEITSNGEVWAPGGTVMVELTDRQYDARRRLALAIASLGGFGAAGTSAVWHVLGQGMSINGYARHVMWNGVKMERRTALGVLTRLIHDAGWRSGCLGGCGRTDKLEVAGFSAMVDLDFELGVGGLREGSWRGGSGPVAYGPASAVAR